MVTYQRCPFSVFICWISPAEHCNIIMRPKFAKTKFNMLFQTNNENDDWWVV